MRVEELEPGMEELLLRHEPDLVLQWKGASEAQIEKIKQLVKKISGNDLPKFYLWFLMRMGERMGPISFPEMDYSASKVISWYDGDWENDGTKFFKIGHTSDEVMELHMYYDFNYTTRDDARLTRRHEEGGDDYKAYETFREMIASSVIKSRAFRSPVSCFGILNNDAGVDILPELDPVMASLGFKKPNIPTGLRCGLYEGKQALMEVSIAPDLVTHITGFCLGASNATILRNILGTIEKETDFSLEIEDDPRRIHG